MSDDVGVKAVIGGHSVKSALRRSARAKVSKFSAEQRHRADEQIAALLGAQLRLLSPKCVGVYRALTHEPDLSSLWWDLEAECYSLALPVVLERGAALMYRQWRSGDALVPDALGLNAPDSRQARRECDVWVIPCVAFDVRGYRLGSGGGYFDRTLAALPAPPILIGVAYEDCLGPGAWAEPHDWRMDYVVTESQMRDFR